MSMVVIRKWLCELRAWVSGYGRGLKLVCTALSGLLKLRFRVVLICWCVLRLRRWRCLRLKTL